MYDRSMPASADCQVVEEKPHMRPLLACAKWCARWLYREAYRGQQAAYTSAPGLCDMVRLLAISRGLPWPTPTGAEARGATNPNPNAANYMQRAIHLWNSEPGDPARHTFCSPLEQRARRPSTPYVFLQDRCTTPKTLIRTFSCTETKQLTTRIHQSNDNYVFRLGSSDPKKLSVHSYM